MAYPTTLKFNPVGQSLGIQPIAESSPAPQHPAGFVVEAKDLAYGEASFIYLQGAAATEAGSAVIYNSTTGATALTSASARGPLSIAMSANLAGFWGWYCIAGSVPVKSATVAGNAYGYVTATAGQLDDAVAVGTLVDGFKFTSADSVFGGGHASCQLNMPSVQADAAGASGVTTMGAFGATPNANGASISGSTLTLQPASSTLPGGVTAGAQTFGGDKTFSTAPISANGFRMPSTDSSGTPGAATANTPTGRAAIVGDNVATSVTITNSLVTAASTILVTGVGGAANLRTWNVQGAAGSLTVTVNAASTQAIVFNWLVVNA